MSFNGPPAGYTTPKFPSLNVQTIHDRSENRVYTLYYVRDVWRFTALWTIIVYVLFHLAAVIIALSTHGRRISTWKYLWVLPIVYIFIAGLQAIVTGSIVGAAVGAVYNAGYYEMNTWIPVVWAFISVLVLIISSFSIQGGL